MALYWPDKKVALDIVDDPYRNPFDGDDSYTVLRVTCEDLCNYESYRKIMGRLCELLGHEMPSMPDWEERSQAFHAVFCEELECGMSIDLPFPFPSPLESDVPDSIEILATSDEEAERMSDAARGNGQRVRGVSVWDGPVPPGSYEDISSSMRMSTPEYFFLRKANQLPFALAVCLGMELCGKYRTALTQYDRGKGYDFLMQPRTSKADVRRYLREIRNTKEGKRAKRVLRYVTDECASPMSCYLYLLLCLPRSRGGYALGRALPSAAFRTEDGFMPDSSGEFMAYDLCWPKKLVAVQYVGSRLLSTRDHEALQTNGMQTVCISDTDVADPQRFDRLARKVASLLGIKVPEATEDWIAARDKLRRQVKMPTFDHMLLTFKHMTRHTKEKGPRRG